MTTPCVFLSSTFADFRRERRLLVEAATLIEAKVVAAENIGNKGCSLRETLWQRITSADVVVLLIGDRYGTESERGVSWTEEEIRLAVDEGKEVFAYVRESDPKSLLVTDRHPQKAEKLAGFIAFVEEHVGVVPRFPTDDDTRLVAMFVRDVVEFTVGWERRAQTDTYEDGFLG